MSKLKERKKEDTIYKKGERHFLVRYDNLKYGNIDADIVNIDSFTEDNGWDKDEIKAINELSPCSQVHLYIGVTITRIV